MNKNLIKATNTFLIPPGEHIQDWLNDCGMSVLEFCKRMEISKPTYYRILNGTQPITADTARRLELVTGASASFWNKLESDYRYLVLCQQAEAQAKSQKEWIKKQPISDLIANNFLPTDFHKRTIGEQITALCSFYNVSSINAYEEIHTPYAFASRTVKGVKSNSTALTAWLQMASLIASEKINNLPPYDFNNFKNALENVRHHTVDFDSQKYTFKDFLLTAKDELAKAGVQIIYLKQIKNVKNLHGVVFWLNNHPIIVLTLLTGTFDEIIFSLYHEAAHILNEKHNFIYVTEKGKSDIELAADIKATELLIPKTFNDSILNTNGSITTLRSLAQTIGVSVALVIGQYQKLSNHFLSSSSYQMPSITWEEIGNWFLV